MQLSTQDTVWDSFWETEWWLPIDLSHVNLESNNTEKGGKISCLLIPALVSFLANQAEFPLAHSVIWYKNRNPDNLLTRILWARNMKCNAPLRMTNAPQVLISISGIWKVLLWRWIIDRICICQGCFKEGKSWSVSGGTLPRARSSTRKLPWTDACTYSEEKSHRWPCT